MDGKGVIARELSQSASVLNAFSQDKKNIEALEIAASFCITALQSGGKIISCGNGGSHCDAMHFAEELTGRFRDDRPPLAAICISDPSHITCVGNDFGFDQIFSRYIKALGKPEDVLLAISTSGNSANIINAAKEARDKKMKVISLTGNNGGKLAGLSDIEIRVPHSGYSDRIQEVHIKIIHILILLIEKGIVA
ncbi:MAG: D-sedoheptulose 7-phosphate isomerase [Flammeovirgaceae bacterium]|nr:D-sedoheptulose 7-phosphate isomerase [Flammeovirgaceae bacterium]